MVPSDAKRTTKRPGDTFVLCGQKRERGDLTEIKEQTHEISHL